ncbi:hypothetical protein SAMN00808754_2332 [Thermanaeromonas toyohensis ToBE]|uniref:PIN domain-containing protein n=1 Tax=Thermanaeromonas toyohensis ToBE TaxID=698762 RepID=A0A1W1VYH7_9FIRM|nr:hypothetical protein SAMN00808754_2332 [Thermanaeromonas toyohensis ToBE]
MVDTSAIYALIDRSDTDATTFAVMERLKLKWLAVL